MADDMTNVLWTNSDWMADARAWITGRLAERSIAQTGEWTQPHVRAWATAIRVPTDRGPMWFKATTPVLAHESRVTTFLSTISGGRTPEVIDSDPERNWLLMADGGVTLRSLFNGSEDAKRLHELVKVYAGLQRDMVPHVESILEMGAPDCRLANFPGLFQAMIEQPDVLLVGQEGGLSRDEELRLQQFGPCVVAMCEELSGFGIPETIQHDDLHSNNVLVNDGRTLVFDWGDCSVSHPFLSLLILLGGAARDLKCEIDDQKVRELRQAYLDVWELSISHAESSRACAIAEVLASISRALTWNRLAVGIPDTMPAEYADYVPFRMRMVLAAYDALTA